MMNSLQDLNNYLFESIERVMDDELTDAEFEREIARSAAVVKVSEQIIHNGELCLQAAKHMAEYALPGYEKMPDNLMLGGGKDGA